jgi:galactokinase/mevalonate kinase-like predicted kinase
VAIERGSGSVSRRPGGGFHRAGRQAVVDQLAAQCGNVVRRDLIERLAPEVRNDPIGGKVSGAGGGRFMMFIGPPHHRVQVIRALTEARADADGVRFVTAGAKSWTVVER